MDQQTRLQKMLQTLDEGTVQKEELAKVLASFLNIVKEVKDFLANKISDVSTTSDKKALILSRELQQLNNKIDTSISNNGVVSQKTASLNTLIDSLKEEIKTIKEALGNIEEYDDSSLNEQLATLKDSIPTIEEIENDLPKLGAKFRDGLELLQGDERLDKSAIKGIDEIEKEIQTLKGKNTVTYSGGNSGGRIARVYDLSDSLDGVTKTFTIPANWRVLSVNASSFPYILRPTTDYTYTPQSITFTSEIDAASTLATGQTITIIYSE